MKQNRFSQQTTYDRLLWVLCSLIFFLTSCTQIPSPEQRYQQAQQLVQKHEWSSRIINTDNFDLVAFTPNHFQPKKEFVVYIEGDGLAWKNIDTVSPDPTPITPIALQLALRDFENKETNIAYLARPCQFVSAEHKKNCESSVWTSERFSEKVVAASNQAIDQLKIIFNAESVTLIGYSGGGAIACLVAARRSDIKKIITVAGNLDHSYWTRLHGVSPLTGSLNPIDFRENIKHIPQLHLVGEKDKNTPPEMIKQFVDGFDLKTKNQETVVQYKIFPGYDHGCCWVRDWKKIFTTESM